MSGPPCTLMRTASAPWIGISSSSGTRHRRLRRLDGAVLPGADAAAEKRVAPVVHDRLHVGEVEVDEAVPGDEVGDAARGLEEHLVGHQHGGVKRRARLDDVQELLVGDGDQRVDVLGELFQPGRRARHLLLPLEEERLGHDGHGEDAQLARHLGHHRRAAGAGAAAHAGGEEEHVGAAQDVGDGGAILLGREPADLRDRRRRPGRA